MKTILSIEDNNSTQEDISNILKNKFKFIAINKDFDSITTEDIVKMEPDLILLDIQLQGRSDSTGIEIARKLKQDQVNIPVIIFSLRSNYKEMLLSDKLCHCFIQKPSDIEEILATIEELLLVDKTIN